MSNSTLYWYVLAAGWGSFIGFCCGWLPPTALAVIPVGIFILALRCVVRPDPIDFSSEFHAENFGRYKEAKRRRRMGR